jgi:HPt (histidine-containing phosphotransfer) domain-containing protein
MEAIGNIFSVEKQTGGGLLDKLVDGYREQMKEKLEMLESAAKREDVKMIYSSAHAIKSMSSNIGAEKVRLISAGIEKNAKAGIAINLARDVADLEIANYDFLTAISELLNSD